MCIHLHLHLQPQLHFYPRFRLLLSPSFEFLFCNNDSCRRRYRRRHRRCSNIRKCMKCFCMTRCNGLDRLVPPRLESSHIACELCRFFYWLHRWRLSVMASFGLHLQQIFSLAYISMLLDKRQSAIEKRQPFLDEVTRRDAMLHCHYEIYKTKIECLSIQPSLLSLPIR